jgi:hypothetical protein
MNTQSDLFGAWHSMMDTLQKRLDECSSDALMQQWMRVVTRMSAISRDTAWWTGLPDEAPAYTRLVTALEAATRALAAARGNPAALRQALDKASDAVALVEQFRTG